MKEQTIIDDKNNNKYTDSDITPTHTHMHTHILVAVASISLCSVLLFLTDLLQFDGFAFLVLCKNVLDPVDL